jgi:glycosyltransferase involved in cell wall biosynthesis
MREIPTIMEVLYSFQLGGSERLAALLGRQFVSRGYRVLASSIHGVDGPIREELEDYGIRSFGFDYANRPRLLRWTMAPQLEKLFREQHVTVAHLHHGLSAIRAARAARRAGVHRIVMTEHSVSAIATLPYRRTIKALRDVHVMTAVSDDVQSYLVETMAAPAHAVEKIPNGVDPVFLKVARNDSARAAANLRGTVFLSLGRLHPDKDLRTLIDAFSLVLGKGVNAALLVVGDGEERAALQARVATLKLNDRVIFYGSSRDVPHFFSLADAFVMSSVSEGLPMALLEAMSAGLPCVATAVGGIPDVINAQNGILVQPRDSDALAEAMIRIATTPQLRRDMGTRARTTVTSRFSVDAMVDQYLHCFGLPPTWSS